MDTIRQPDAERIRLDEDRKRLKNWKRWGPYLAERQWGTVREDYSKEGDPWTHFPHDHARSRVYRWGEDGLLGISDREGRLCFALALWNHKDPILKERLFGLTNPEGNHGEDVKECYHYLDATPTHSYMRALYRYPTQCFPYRRLVLENGRRSRSEPEFELVDSGALDGGRSFDVFVEYAKGAPDDVLVKITVVNNGPVPAPLVVLPTLWFRNTWSWGRDGEGYWPKPFIEADQSGSLTATHSSLGRFRLVAGPSPDGARPGLLFTENETNRERLYGQPNACRFVKDGFHSCVVDGRQDAVNPAMRGTKAAFRYDLSLEPGERVELLLRLFTDVHPSGDPISLSFNEVFGARRRECDAFWHAVLPERLSVEERNVARQAYAGLLWSKQFYHLAVDHWLEGDPAGPPPPDERRRGRNRDWEHLYNRDVVSVPDKWEYPWYAAWDLAFHALPLARVDPDFAKAQLVLLLREWYMHPNGQLPAYELNFGDANPPVHAWAAWRVYKMTGRRGARDRAFLARVFQKLLINFTWWVNRQDVEGRHIFSGGFLGLDNVGFFDRSKPLPVGGHLEQADGTAWMAFTCATMLSMALELASDDPTYEDVASKFFEHFVAITAAMNNLGGTGLWDELDGFYYDRIRAHGHAEWVKIRSVVGIVPLFAVEILEERVLERLPGFTRRMRWFLENRPHLARHITRAERTPSGRFECRADDPACTVGWEPREGLVLLSVADKERLVRVLRFVLDEAEFLSPYGVRSLSRVHRDRPFVSWLGGVEQRVEYAPGESTSGLFGGNSNWRGPIWLPINYLLIEALERHGRFYGDTLTVEHPTGSGRRMTLTAVARDLAARLAGLFMPDEKGNRPCHGPHDAPSRSMVLFHEYFHGETGRGLGASHQTGWTALVVHCLERLARGRQ